MKNKKRTIAEEINYKKKLEKLPKVLCEFCGEVGNPGVNNKKAKDPKGEIIIFLILLIILPWVCYNFLSTLALLPAVIPAVIYAFYVLSRTNRLKNKIICYECSKDKAPSPLSISKGFIIIFIMLALLIGFMIIFVNKSLSTADIISNI